MSNTPLLGSYSRTIPRIIWWSKGGGLFLMSEVPCKPETRNPKLETRNSRHETQPRGGLRPFKSPDTFLKLTLGPHVVQIWSRYTKAIGTLEVPRVESKLQTPDPEPNFETRNPRPQTPKAKASHLLTYRGASLIRKRTPLGPIRRPTPRVLGGS